ncbi:MAG: DUF58 domain-containing protein [Inquilinaceae bacterium]
MADAPDSFRTQQRAEALAATLPPLLVAAERVAATVAQGVHGRRRTGVGESFWQFRRYDPGDTIQRIDWRQSAKTQTVFVRELEWEASQTVWLWRDGSASMRYASSPGAPTKRDRADLVLLALAVLLNRAGERAALLGGAGPPAAGRINLARIAMDLEGTPDDDNGVPPAAQIPRHAELILIGDFLAPLADLNDRVKAYAARGVRGHMLQILDPAEVTLPFAGRVRFAGLEGETETLIPRVEAVRTTYQERLQAQQNGLEAMARSVGWTFAVHRTDRPPQTALLGLYATLGNIPLRLDDGE